MMLEPFVLPYQGHLLAGTDEAGRGPLAGSVVAAAVILNPENPIQGLTDSKKLSEKKRDELFGQIQEKALCFAIAESTVAEIDQLNILQASLLAMHRAVQALTIQPEFVAVDGNKLPKWHYASQAVVKGDARVAAIAAASILAKVTRDRQLIELDKQYPGYGFAAHKAYPTKQHLQALQTLGVTPAHRRSYKPVQQFLSQ
jgi:ribonuclease HII